jgi:hypothetical protein
VAFVVAVYREAVTRGIALPDLKPANIGFYAVPGGGAWRLIDHDMMAPSVDDAAVGTFGAPPPEFTHDESWVAVTRWAAAVTALWPVMEPDARRAVLTPEAPNRYAVVMATASEHPEVAKALNNVGIL